VNPCPTLTEEDLTLETMPDLDELNQLWPVRMATWSWEKRRKGKELQWRSRHRKGRRLK
jgi:hypothetical protein